MIIVPKIEWLAGVDRFAATPAAYAAGCDLLDDQLA
jgi:hypothetical protein